MNFRNFLLALMLLPGMAGYVSAELAPGTDVTLAQQRHHFVLAKQALARKKWADYKKHKAKLKSYPLYPHLEYRDFKNELWISKQSVATLERKYNALLKRYPHWTENSSLKFAWLQYLSRKKQWKRFIKAYDKDTRSTTLKCLYARALYKNRQVTKGKALGAELWLTGRNQNGACNPVFKIMEQRKHLTTKLILERIDLAMKKRNLSLMRHLIEKKLPKTYHHRLKKWEAMHGKKTAKAELYKALKSPAAYTPEMVKHGMWRFSDRHPDQAKVIWPKLQKKFKFNDEQYLRVEYLLALDSAIHNTRDALERLINLDSRAMDEKLIGWRLRVMLRNQDWKGIIRAHKKLPEEKQAEPQSQYWLARAKEQLGQHREAHTIYRTLAKAPTYYGFMSADRLGLEYSIPNRPVKPDAKIQADLLSRRDILGSREFFLVRMEGPARVAWRRALTRIQKDESMPKAQRLEYLKQAGLLALNWGWYSEGIVAMGRAQYDDDLDVRFPFAYGHYLLPNARRQQINPAWVLGLARAESLFRADVGSHAGARGLMQIMPATGRLLARQQGIKLRNRNEIKSRLLNPGFNTRLGTSYLRQMLNKFDGNEILATAAYNAGPHRVEKWTPREKDLPIDIWIDLIPFKETRHYVRRVMRFSVVFDSRINGKPQRLKDRLPHSVFARPPEPTGNII